MRVRDNILDEPSSRRRLSNWLQEKLFERRIVLVTGRLDADLAAEAAAALMTLDAIGDEPIELHVNSPDGTLESAFVLIDTLDLRSTTGSSTTSAPPDEPPRRSANMRPSLYVVAGHTSVQERDRLGRGSSWPPAGDLTA
jgi:hypothetical protein